MTGFVCVVLIVCEIHIIDNIICAMLISLFLDNKCSCSGREFNKIVKEGDEKVKEEG